MTREPSNRRTSVRASLGALLAGLLIASLLAAGASASPGAAAGTQWVDLAPGGGFSCGVRSNGSLWCWGDNSFGQLGNGTTTPSDVPVQVGVDTDWSQVDTGTDHACALRTDHELWCWGSNGVGELGDGTKTDSSVPVQVERGASWANVVTGRQFSCAIALDKAAWCWGQNDAQQLGLGPGGGGIIVPDPTRVDAPKRWSVLSAGWASTCGLRTNATMWCWGWNAHGVVGIGKDPRYVASPTRVRGRNWSVVSVGVDSACAVKRAGASGSLWCWGSNATAALGLGPDAGGAKHFPTRLSTPAGWESVSAGDYGACAIDVSQHMWCWGNNSHGQDGRGRLGGLERKPRLVPGDQEWTSVSTGEDDVFATSANARAWAWGRNDTGQLGIGSEIDQSSPQQLP